MTPALKAGMAKEGISRGWLRFGLGCFVSAWILWQVGWQPAHIFNATRFILYDQGSYLYAIERLNHGEMLYRDLHWQYGPLAAGWYWGWAQLGGNSPLVLVLVSSALMAGAWWLLADLTLEVIGKRAGIIWALLGLLPAMSPSGLIALNGPHGALEMLLLAACAWLLAKFPERNRRAWLLGFTLGALHWVRFGPGVVAFLALLVLEGWRLRSDVLTWRAGIAALGGWLLRVLSAYVLSWLPLLVFYYARLPWSGVFEQLWPGHMVAHYAATYSSRWPEWPGVRGLLITWLPVLCGLAGLLAWFSSGKGRNKVEAYPVRPAALCGLVFGPLYWVFGNLMLFRNDYAMVGHLWLVWPGLAVCWALAGRRLRLGLVALMVPALGANLLGVKAVWQEEQTWQAAPMRLPNGQRLWFRPGEARRFAELGEVLNRALSGEKLAVFIAGGGVHYFYGTQRVGRHWWYLPEFVRPWEAVEAERALLRHHNLFVADFGQNAAANGSSGVLPLWLPLPADMSLRLLPRLTDASYIDGLGHMMRIRPSVNHAPPPN